MTCRPWWALALPLIVGCPPSIDFGVADARIDGGVRPPTDGAADAALDAGTPDAGPSDGATDTAADSGDAGFDAGVPPWVDFTCAAPWTTISPSDTRCARRQVTRITLAPALQVDDVAIARTPGGRVGMAYDSRAWADEGSIEFAAVTESTTTVVQSATITGFPFEVVGLSLALRRGTREQLHLGYWVRESAGGRAAYRQIPAGGVPTSEEVVDVGSATGKVDLAVDPSGNVHMVWYDVATGVTSGRTRSVSTLAWSPRQIAASDLSARPPSSGDLALVVDAAALTHLAYQRGVGSVSSQVRSTTRTTASSWSMSTTRSLNPASARLTGMGLDLVRDRTGRITAGYLDWLGGTGEIRLASWNPSATSHATVVAAMPMTGRPDSFALAMDVDSEGRLHFVAAVPTSDVTKELRYYWQVTPGLGSPWAFDVVDSDVYLAGSPALADMVVSPGGQPHIIYFDPSTGHVSYATILAP